MKKIAAIVLISTLFFSCGAQKTTPLAEHISATSECPKDGSCEVTLFPNKSLSVQSSDIGSLYYTLQEDVAKKVIKYTYIRKVKGNLQDAAYREEIILELDNAAKDISLADEMLTKNNFLFGRFCFCRGQTGYYKISKGTLSLASNNKATTIDFSFTVPEVPQVIKHLTLDLN